VAFLDEAPPIAFAHRGYADGGDENSLAAFQRAVDLGYRYLETDVRATADGVALAFHDSRLDRVTDRRGVVSQLPWSTVSKALIAGREPIPRLVDVLAAWPDVRVNVDVKSSAGVTPVVEAIRRTGAADRVCVTAFSDRRIAVLCDALGPRVVTGLGPRAALAVRLAVSRGRPLPPFPGRCLQIPPRVGRVQLVDVRLIEAAHAAGLAVHVWTVNELHEMRRVLDLGVDGVMTDRAAVLRDLLRERGQWPAGA
jgi:glycerophosphoryl diester phosphodiesterase